jgi:hypothetical protein
MIFQNHPKEISKSSKGNGEDIQRKIPKIANEITEIRKIFFIKQQGCLN